MDSSGDYARRVRAQSCVSPDSELVGPRYRHLAGVLIQDNQVFLQSEGVINMRSEDEDIGILQHQVDPDMAISEEDSATNCQSVNVQPYSQSDLSGWIDCMIDELQSSSTQLHGQQEPQHNLTSPNSSVVSVESSLDSLDSQGSFHQPFPPTAAVIRDLYATDDCQDSSIFGGSSPGDDTGVEASGLRLVHLLMACAESVQRNDMRMAEGTVRRIQLLAAPQRGSMAKVAAHFSEALARRIYRITAEPLSDPLIELLHFQYYEFCPYLKFAHFTANQVILEAVQNCRRIHVIDCNLLHGLQWPALIQALALRPGGPPVFRLTGIGPPHQSGNDVLQEIGMKLAQLADLVNVQFEFRGVYAQKLDDVKPYMLHVRHGEAVCVNSIMQLHRLVHSHGSPTSPLQEVLQSMLSLRPKIFTLIEQEANHNSPVFLERFTEALHYYSAVFDSLEACTSSTQSAERLLAEMYVGKEISNIIACEGTDRAERHENLVQWRRRMTEAGYQQRHLGSNVFKQASTLLTLLPGDGYRVEESSGCLTLGWHTRPLIAASAWHCS